MIAWHPPRISLGHINTFGHVLISFFDDSLQTTKVMKSLHACLMVFLIGLAASGCSESKQNSLATDGATADDFAKYEAELAAVTGAEAHEDTDDMESE
ncbi:MAG: hypothetical protein KDB00_28820 [Planctomycetales bacterium]|nr:hypothetical protein [Planctomycetales bacterium]